MTNKLKLTKKDYAQARSHFRDPDGGKIDPRVEALVHELIGRVADKWTMLVLETLEETSPLRFSRISAVLPGISQKMLTQTLRQMERDGLLTRVVYPEVPPRVEYSLTALGKGLSHAFCSVWVWAGENLEKIEQARQAFDKRKPGKPAR
jgi:DNA-binding HxlR family transcriptional regulator